MPTPPLAHLGGVSTHNVVEPRPFATSDVYLGVFVCRPLSLAMCRQLVNDADHLFVHAAIASPGGTTYYWKVVSRTNATPGDPTMISVGLQSFTTTGGTPLQAVCERGRRRTSARSAATKRDPRAACSP